MIKVKALAAGIAAAVALATPLACGSMQYDDGYSGPAYVIGPYAGGSCVSPVTGEPEYCELLSDGTYQVVPYGIYNSAPYGSVLSFSHNHYNIVHTSITRSGRAPDVSYSSYRTAKRVSARSYSASSYNGMSSYGTGKSRGTVVYSSSGSNGSRATQRSGSSVYRSSGSRH
jgi:hypothetical protein